MDDLNNLLTIVVPVKNEERNLPGCLENVKAFEHVILVDSGSTDRTLEIAAEFGREVVQFKWNGEFPKKRNWILRNYKFQTPWVLFLDADMSAIAPHLIYDGVDMVNLGSKCVRAENWRTGSLVVSR